MKNRLVVIFDLDDTLYKEIDFLKSAYTEIATMLSEIIEERVSANDLFTEMMEIYHCGENAFQAILNNHGIRNYTVKDLISEYRNHQPNIALTGETKALLDSLHSKSVAMGLITDGRSIQQRNKIKALGLEDYFSHIIISEEVGSEKPNLRNFLMIQEEYLTDETTFMYIGDNLKKDFIVPNELGWMSICLKDNGSNIHNQNIDVPETNQPRHFIADLSEVTGLIRPYL